MATLQPWLVALLALILGFLLALVLLRAPWERLRQFRYHHRWLGTADVQFAPPPTPPRLKGSPPASDGVTEREPTQGGKDSAPPGERRYRIAIDEER